MEEGETCLVWAVGKREGANGESREGAVKHGLERRRGSSAHGGGEDLRLGPQGEEGEEPLWEMSVVFRLPQGVVSVLSKIKYGPPKEDHMWTEG